MHRRGHTRECRPIAIEGPARGDAPTDDDIARHVETGRAVRERNRLIARRPVFRDLLKCGTDPRQFGPIGFNVVTTHVPENRDDVPFARVFIYEHVGTHVERRIHEHGPDDVYIHSFRRIRVERVPVGVREDELIRRALVHREHVRTRSNHFVPEVRARDGIIVCQFDDGVVDDDIRRRYVRRRASNVERTRDDGGRCVDGDGCWIHDRGSRHIHGEFSVRCDELGRRRERSDDTHIHFLTRVRIERRRTRRFVRVPDDKLFGRRFESTRDV